MAAKSDLILDASKFDPSNITEQTRKFNEHLATIMRDTPNWWEVGIQKFRRMRENGQTPLPGLSTVKDAETVSLPSRDPNRKIPCRVVKPQDPNTKAKAVFYHIHGGGWVLGSEYGQDHLLQYFANHAGLVVVSVGYRLAPEHPNPAPNEDCYDVGEYLVDNAQRDFGVPLGFIGGESAGGHLSAVTILHLLRARPQFEFKGAVLSYGAFNIGPVWMPQVYNFDLPLVLNHEIMEHYLKAYLPNPTPEIQRDMFVSPFFAPLHKMKIPPAIFLCGTLDVLLDDSVMMSNKWAMTGTETILKLYPGGVHGFTLFAPGYTETTQQGLDDIVAFIQGKN